MYSKACEVKKNENFKIFKKSQFFSFFLKESLRLQKPNICHFNILNDSKQLKHKSVQLVLIELSEHIDKIGRNIQFFAQS